MGCKEIVENTTYATELIKEIKLQAFRYYVVIIVLVIALIAETGYIFYDRYMDSKIEVEATTTEVIQDGAGYNNYHDGLGDIVNGAKSNKDNN